MSMTPERATLKLFLMTERVVTLTHPTVKSIKRTGLFCELCGKQCREGYRGREFVSGLDMHEVIITRGNVCGNDRLMKLITESKLNAALVCNDCNLNRADTKWAVKLLTAKLIMRYGADTIVEWIDSLEMKTGKEFAHAVRACELEMREAALNGADKAV